MLVFGTQVHIVTFIFIILEFIMFSYQIIYYLSRPQDKGRMWYLILLFLMLFYNITGGLFPDPKIPISITFQNITAYGSGFLMASYFPFYFYKALDLKALRFHALYGVPLFLLLPYLIFLVIAYCINGNLQKDIDYGMIIPFIYSMVLVWAMYRAIKIRDTNHPEKSNYLENLSVYFAVIPWASMTVFSIFQVQQLTEVLFTNSGIIVITILFISKSIKTARSEYAQLIQLSNNLSISSCFEENCAVYQLTPREIEIVKLIREGYKYREIGEKLFIAERTVTTHVQHMFEKTRTKNKVELLHKLEKAQVLKIGRAI